MKKLAALLLALAMLFSLAACGSGESQQTDNTDQNPTNTVNTGPQDTDQGEEPPVELSGEVNIYAAGSEAASVLLKETFEEMHPGVTINYISMGGGEIQTRVEAEAANPQADFIWGGGCEAYMTLKDEGLLYSYQSPSAAGLTDMNHDPDWYWTAITNSYLGFYCDQDWFDEHDMELPTSWQDLLDPRLEGHIVITNPSTSTTGYMVLSTIVQLMGEEEGLAYFTELNKNVKNYPSSGSAPSQSVALGESAVGIGYMQHGLRLANEGYTNLVVTAPSEGTGLEISGMAIVNNCKNLEAAKAVMDWCASKEFGQLFADTLGSSMTASGACTDDMAAYAGTKLVDLDYAWAAENMERLIGEWDKIVSN